MLSVGMRPGPRLFLVTLLAGCGARTAPDVGATEPEVCDGLDNDGDGRIDEGFPTLVCGVGACRIEALACVGGAMGECVPAPPSDERCNGIDDDCDGSVDEELGWGPIAGPYTAWDERGGGAFDLELEPTDEGFLLTWRTSFDGSAPTPNLFVVRLDEDGRPLEEARPLLMRNATRGPRVAPSSDGRWVLTFCGRWGFENRATSAFMDARGELVGSEILRTPGDRGCGAAEPDGLWTGRAHLHTWITNSTSPDGDYVVLLDVADEAGASRGEQILARGGDTSVPARLAIDGDGVLLVAGVRPEPGVSQLWLWRLGADGETLAPPVIVDSPSPEVFFGEPEIVRRPSGGFVVLTGGGSSAGLWRLEVDPGGAVGELTPIEAVVDRVSELTFEAGLGDSFLFACNLDAAGAGFHGFVARFDRAFALTGSWIPDPAEGEEWLGWPAFATRSGRTFVAYWITDPLQEVRVRELGCIP